MQELSLVCFWGLVGLTVYSAVFALITVINMLAKRRLPSSTDDDLPKVAILLSLRGADPSLATCLRRLLDQDYPQYDLKIAVDSENDPAWRTVQTVLRETKATNVVVRPLERRLTTCSLKCSALVQLVDDLDGSHKVIALADADLVCHRTWLRELVSPLLDPQIGVTYGNRWFMPTRGWMGSLVRQLWNAPGLVVMHLFGIPWAGSMAIRSDVFHQGKIRDKWARSIVDDGPVRAAVKSLKLKLHFVSSLVMANREECDVVFAYHFLRRQLTWTRTYITGWWIAMCVYLSIALGLNMLTVGLACISAFQGDDATATMLFQGLTISCGGATCLWLLLDGAARCVIRRQGEPAPSSIVRQMLYMPIVMGFTLVIHVVASIVATVRRRVVWRGVTYEIRGPSDVRVISDHGLAMPRVSSAVSVSL